ncbi:hypothetical protein HJC23_009934 [Cyclotella cryptica]|uniref:Reverse transcriptase domain-containing protein n=1 Tax=Cyclotella cryptica TaxID=29204 RepID=A0ABD3P0D7_9STRA
MMEERSKTNDAMKHLYELISTNDARRNEETKVLRDIMDHFGDELLKTKVMPGHAQVRCENLEKELANKTHELSYFQETSQSENETVRETINFRGIKQTNMDRIVRVGHAYENHEKEKNYVTGINVTATMISVSGLPMKLTGEIQKRVEQIDVLAEIASFAHDYGNWVAYQADHESLFDCEGTSQDEHNYAEDDRIARSKSSLLNELKSKLSAELERAAYRGVLDSTDGSTHGLGLIWEERDINIMRSLLHGIVGFDLLEGRRHSEMRRHSGNHGVLPPSKLRDNTLYTPNLHTISSSSSSRTIDALTTLKSIVISRFYTDSQFTTWLLHEFLPPFASATISATSTPLNNFDPHRFSLKTREFSSYMMPTVAPDSTDVAMGETSPPRMAGSKRAAVNFACHHSSWHADDCNTELKPARLEDKFEAPPKKKASSSTDAFLVLQHPNDMLDDLDDAIDLTDKKVYEELLSEPKPPSSGECLAYTFDNEDDFTKQHIYTLNGLKLEELMRQKTLRCKQQDRSQAHPKWGPFRLQNMDNSGDMEIVNSKGKKALYFKPEDFSISTGELSFQVDDTVTYTLLCYVGPKAIALQVSTARRKNRTLRDDNGPFLLSRNAYNSKLIDVSKSDGVFHTFDPLHTPRPSDEDWIPVGQQGASALKNRVSFCLEAKEKSSKQKRSSNQYGALSEVDPSDLANSTNAEDDEDNASESREDSSQDTSDKDPDDGSGEDNDDEDMDDASSEKEGDKKPSGDETGLDSDTPIIQEPREPVEIHITPHVQEWYDDESDGEAAKSGDEKTPPKLNLKDIAPTPSVATTSSNTAFSSLSQDRSLIIDPNSGQHLLSFEIQLQPGKEHLTVLLDETKRLLDYVQELDPTARFISKDIDSDNKPYPDLTSSKNPHWPNNFVNAQHWFQVPGGFVFTQPPVTEKQLQARLETRRNRYRANDSGSKRRKSKKSGGEEDKGPTSIYAIINLYTALPKISTIIEAMNIDLRRYNARVLLKPLQVWESHSKKMLCGVHNGLCIEGVKQLLMHRLKEMEKKLCRHGKMDTLEWYDSPLPAINVTTRTIRELKLPDDKEERARLSFDSFPRSSKFAYFLEASDAAWNRLDPLLSIMVDTNDLSQTLGPSAFIMDVPGNVSAERYNSSTRSQGENATNHNPTGETLQPKPPYAKTTHRKELQRIRFNEKQIFHTAVMTCRGPETGISSIVVAYDPHDPLYREKYAFAERTVANLACFMHHWLLQCGYCESTRDTPYALLYIEKAQLAPQSPWDPVTLTATSHFAGKPTLFSEIMHTTTHTSVSRCCLDRSRVTRSRVSGASALTGDGDTTGASTVNSEATANRVLKAKDYALQLADSKARNAEQAAEINALKIQMQQLTKMLAGINQLVPPHLSGSGAAPAQDEGGAQAGSNRDNASLATGSWVGDTSELGDNQSAPMGRTADIRGARTTPAQISNQIRNQGTNRGSNRRAKSQRRQDRWRQAQASVEQKRKYRAFLQGYRSLQSKCTPTDADIERMTDRREMEQLVHLLQDGGAGYMPRKKRSGWVRIMFENWNSLGIFTHGWKMDRLNQLVKDLQVDVVAGCIAANNVTEVINRDQMGGTAVTAIGRLSDVVTAVGCDVTGLGRWSWIRVGTALRSTRVVCGYMPCKPGRSARGHTVWEQHLRYFQSRGDFRYPSTIFVDDLANQLAEWRRDGMKGFGIVDVWRDYPTIARPKSRSLTTKITRIRRKYCQTLAELSERHKMEEKLELVKTLAGQSSTDIASRFHNRWDKEMGEHMRHSKRAVLKWLLRWHEGKVPDTRNMCRAARRANILDPLRLSAADVKTRLRACLDHLFELKKDAPALRRKHLQWRLQVAKQQEDDEASTEVLRIIRREASRQRQRNINKVVKDPRGRSVLSVGVTTGTEEYWGTLKQPKRILENDYTYSDKWDASTVDLLKACAKLRLECDDLATTEYYVTQDDFIDFWATSKESTSSSKSGRHFGHYRAITEDESLVSLHVTSINLAAGRGRPLDRWREGVTVLLEKVAGNNRIDKLRAICLLEADFNWWLKGATSGKTALDSSMSKQFFFDQANVLHQTVAVTSTDAANCYDAVNHTAISMALQAMHVPLMVVKCYLLWIQTMKFFLKTGFGMAKQSYGGTVADPYMGLTQGSGASPAAWTAISTVMLSAYKTKGHGAYFVSAWTGICLSIAALLYVDDTDLLHMNTAQESDEDFFGKVVDGTAYWARLLQSTGGNLKPEKCYWYFMAYKFVKGVAILRPAKEMSRPGASVAIELKDPSEASEVLGVWSSPTGTSTSQLDHMIGKGRKWSTRVLRSTLRPSEVWHSFTTQALPSVRYGLIALMASPRDLDDAFSAWYYTLLPALGLAISLQYLQRHWGRSSTMGTILRANFELVQIDIGLSGNFLCRDYKKFQKLATHTWFKTLWEYLHRYGVKLELSGVDVPLIRQRDRVLMEEVIDLIPPHQWPSFNRARKYYKVYFVSQLTLCDGITVDPSKLGKENSVVQQSSMRFPLEKPTKADLEVWRDTISLITSRTFRLSPRLGKHIRPPCDTVCWMTDAANTLLVRKEGDSKETVYVPVQTRYSTRGRQQYRQSTVEANTSECRYYASVIEASKTLISLHSQSLMMCREEPLQVHSLRQALSQMGECQFLNGLSITGDGQWLLEAYAMGTLLACHDGSYMPEHDDTRCSAAVILLCRITGSICTITYCETSTAEVASNYRGELIGGVAITAALLALQASTEVAPTTRFLIYCDNMGVVGHRNRRYKPLPEKQPQTDLILLLRHNLDRLSLKVEYVHVYSHLDEHTQFNQLTLPQQLNVIADKVAKECLLDGIARFTRYGPTYPDEPIRVWIDACCTNGRWSATWTITEVAWAAVGKAMLAYPQMYTLWVTKHVSGFNGTNRHLSRIDNSIVNRCPCCGEADESTAHITRCLNPGRQRVFQQSVDTMLDWMEESHCDQNLIECLEEYLLRRGRRSMRNIARGLPHLNAWADEMDILGWDNFMEGRIGNTIFVMQKEWLKHSGSRRHINSWSTEFIHHVLGITHKQWIFRNMRTHICLLDGKTATEHNDIMEQVGQLLFTDPRLLLPEHRYLLDLDFTELGSGSTTNRQYWIATLTSALEASRHSRIGDRPNTNIPGRRLP